MKAKKVKDFHKSSSFLLHLTDAHILAAMATELKVDNWKGIREKMVSVNWRISDPGLVFKLRQEKEEERDLVYENAMLLLQQGLVYRRFCQAIRTEDAGWLRHCLKFVTIWLQNDDPKCGKLSNYRAESVHLMSCLLHE